MKTLRDCDAPFTWVAVDAAGELRCCCHSRAVLGNVIKQDFNAIWNGPELSSIRRAVSEDRFHSYCKGAACEFSINSQTRIAQHGGPISSGTIIAFGREGNALDYTTSGWSAPEDSWSWSASSTPRLQLGATKDRIIRSVIIAWRALASAERPQTVTITLAGRKIGREHFTDQDPRISVFRIPWLARYRIKRNSTELAFHISDPRTAQSMNPASTDTRNLGVAIREIEFN